MEKNRADGPSQTSSPEGLAEPHLAIAVVEDDQAVLKVLTLHLRSLGYKTRGFASAEDFLESLEWGPSIDCIISDVRLPQADGLQLIRILLSRGFTAPVVLVTGHGDVSMAVEAMKIGAADFIEKPLQPEQLEEAIRNVIQRASHKLTRDDEIADAKRRLAKLSERQLEIIDLIVAGLTSKEIGVKLRSSHRTIEAHRASIFAKLEIESLAQLVRIKIIAELVP